MARKRAKNILFGFHAPEFVDNVVQELVLKGETVSTCVRQSKKDIKEFLVSHPEFRHVVLLETVSKDGKNEKFSAEELSKITDSRNINIIVVLSEAHRGTSYMKTLYAANITSALFQTEQEGISETMVSSLILKRRSRRAARSYYGIDMKPIPYTSVGVEKEFVLSNLNNPHYGVSLLERFLLLSKGMKAHELADLISALSNDIKNELCRYEEFFILVNHLRKKGQSVRVKKPKKLEFGFYISDEDLLSTSELHYEAHELEPSAFFRDDSAEKIQIQEQVVEEQPVVKPKSDLDDEGVVNLSIEDLYEEQPEEDTKGDSISYDEIEISIEPVAEKEMEPAEVPKDVVKIEVPISDADAKEPDSPEQITFIVPEDAGNPNVQKADFGWEEPKEVQQEASPSNSQEDELGSLLEKLKKRNETTRIDYGDLHPAHKELGVIDIATVPRKPKYEAKDFSSLLD